MYHKHVASTHFAATCFLRLFIPKSQWQVVVAVLLAVTEIEDVLLAVCVPLRIGNTKLLAALLSCCLPGLNLLCCFRRHTNISKGELVGGLTCRDTPRFWWKRVSVHPGDLLAETQLYRLFVKYLYLFLSYVYK